MEINRKTHRKSQCENWFSKIISESILHDNYLPPLFLLFVATIVKCPMKCF